MQDSKLKQYYDIFTDCWHLMKENHDIGQGEQYEDAWDEVVYKSDKIYRKYNTDFARQLVMIVVCELEKQSKTPR